MCYEPIYQAVRHILMAHEIRKHHEEIDEVVVLHLRSERNTAILENPSLGLFQGDTVYDAIRAIMREPEMLLYVEYNTISQLGRHLSYYSFRSPARDPTSVLMIVYIQAENGRPVHGLEADHSLTIDSYLYQLVLEEPSTRRPEPAPILVGVPGPIRSKLRDKHRYFTEIDLGFLPHRAPSLKRLRSLEYGTQRVLWSCWVMMAV